MRFGGVAAALLILGGGCASVDGDDDDSTEPDVIDSIGCVPTEWIEAPECGSGPVARDGLVPGTGDAAFDAALASKADRHDRLFHAVFAASTGVNTEVAVDLANASAIGALTAFVDSDAWEFEAETGVPLTDLVTGWAKAAGAYAGVGIAADAYRYGVLRDEGAPCEDVERARTLLLRSLNGLHLASAITGVPGVIARGFARTDQPGHGQLVTTTPLFDDAGDPLPAEKDNGTWRADNSGGDYPNYVWEDSCSRDMLMGWVTAYGAVWEVIGRDPSIDEAVRDELRADAAAIARSLMTVQDSGYDLEIMDADGRRTFHGILHEESIDTVYTPTITNGPNALMAVGAVAALSSVAGQADIQDWLDEQLLGERGLDTIARDRSHLLHFGVNTNFSGYNMAFGGGLLAERLTCDDAVRAVFAEAVDATLYDNPAEIRRPVEQGQALYDLAALEARRGGWAWDAALGGSDDAVMGSLLTTLSEFPDAPYWSDYVEHCDADEIASGVCVATDGTPITVLSATGWNEEVVAEEPLPMRLRPPSNYHWRSNPYRVNGGNPAGTTLNPAVDFRFTYWMARWLRR